MASQFPFRQCFFSICYLQLLFMVLPCLGAFNIDRSQCSKNKGCFFKPAGCDPGLDCTLALVFWVSAPNTLKVQMIAQAIQPPVPLQYIAIGFSNDTTMGDDAVTECVLDQGGSEPEIFVSYNNGKANNRIYLAPDERKTLIGNISGSISDGILNCEFTQQIIPQIDSHLNRIWPLNKKYHILAATGGAQPDEVNAHDTSPGSHLYPIVSPRPLNPSLIGNPGYPLPADFVPSRKTGEQPAPSSQSTVVLSHPILLFFSLSAALLLALPLSR